MLHVIPFFTFTSRIMSKTKTKTKPIQKVNPKLNQESQIEKETSSNLNKPFKCSLKNIFIASTCLKILLFPAYHSTDFEVHRNWLAITNTLPLSKWYTESTSQWTLDYPPFFAWFEFIISKFIPNFIIKNDGILDIVEKGNDSWSIIIFQRTSVIISELVLFGALQYYINYSRNQSNSEKIKSFIVASSIVLSPGLFIIDHIHFQYNGMMYGIMFLSLFAAQRQKPLLSGILFAVLLCFKHIYLYLAPAWFIYLLKIYCLDLSNFNWKFKKTYLNSIKWLNLIKLSSSVLIIFLIAFGPWIYFNQIDKVLKRLFPFARGLTHAYWAPNIWALYSFIDRILTILIGKQSFGSTRGIVGDVVFTILPDITPRITFLLTLFYDLISLIPLFINPSYEKFIACLTLCGYSSFLFGYHVHEKAILLVIFPFTLIVPLSKRLLGSFSILVISGYISLFPLLFTSGEYLIKIIYTYIWIIIFLKLFENICDYSNSNSNTTSLNLRIFYFDRLLNWYKFGFIPLLISLTLIFDIKILRLISLFNLGPINEIILKINLEKYEFLKLMLISTYCSIGVIMSWIGLSWLYFMDDEIFKSENSIKKNQ